MSFFFFFFFFSFRKKEKESKKKTLNSARCFTLGSLPPLAPKKHSTRLRPSSVSLSLSFVLDVRSNQMVR